MRKLTVDNMIFQWKVGKSNVLIRDPNGCSHHIPIDDMSVITFIGDNWEPKITVFPKRVSQYIKDVIIPCMN